MSEAKYNLYCYAKCVSGRGELVAITGKRVAIISRKKLDDSSWNYVISTENSHEIYECVEADLEMAEPVNIFVDNNARTFPTIRLALSSYLHQDFEIFFGSVTDALFAVVNYPERETIIAELKQLESAGDETVKEVLGDHAVWLWDDTTPRDLLITLRTLVNLL